MQNDKSNSTLTHTYYDLKESKDKTNYWRNPNKQKYYDSSVAIPLFNDKRFFTELAIYPNFPKCNFNIDLNLYDTKGKLISYIKKSILLKIISINQLI